jgi:hypothetical protein
MGRIFNCYAATVIFFEEQWHMRREYLPELINWALFALVMAALVFTLGFAAGYWQAIGKTPTAICKNTGKI